MFITCRSCVSLFSVTIAKYLRLGVCKAKWTQLRILKVRALCVRFMPNFDEDIRAGQTANACVYEGSVCEKERTQAG